ncbi:hypothetical protein AURDEDRAFT_137267 [Auricularia subglabra TFB-10046 SS5]|nr:hypothetical protein AURDEDRAFT_137267 [Auricularia subglabra TFB-10046 SS5]
MDARHKARFVDYVQRVGSHVLSNWPDYSFCPEDAMNVLKAEIAGIVSTGLADAGRKWNSSQPVNRLPVELVWAVCSNLTLKERGRASHICSNWRSAIVTAPFLWNVIDDEDTKGHCLPTFLERSGSAPLSITCWDFEVDAVAYWVENHLSHMKRLSVGLNARRAEIVLRSPAPMLETLSVRCPRYTLRSDVFCGQSAMLVDVSLASVHLPDSTPVRAFLATQTLRFEPSIIQDVDPAHILDVFPSLITLILDMRRCPVDGGGPIIPSAGDIRNLAHVVLEGPTVYVSRLIRYFSGRVRRLTVNAAVNVLPLVLIPPSGGLPTRRLTWMHRDCDAASDSITVYQASEPWIDPSSTWRCFQREPLDETVNLSWFVMSSAYTESLTSLVLHDTFWPMGPASLPRMPVLQFLTVICAARRLRPELYFAGESSAKLECHALQAVCLGAIDRGWGNRNWTKVPPNRASFFVRKILGFGIPHRGGLVRRVKELAFKNLSIVEEEIDEVYELAERVSFHEDPKWDGLWF